MPSSTPTTQQATTVRRAAATAGGEPDTAVKHRICILSDDLSGNPDEGVKKVTIALAEALSTNHHVRVISTQGPVTLPKIHYIPTAKSLLSWKLRHALREYNPDILIYASRGSATYFSFLRCRALQAYCPNARMVMFGLQTRIHTQWQQKMLRYLAPDLIMVQSTLNQEYLNAIGCQAALLPAGVDLERFKPVDPVRRRELRLQFDLDTDRPVVLHIGHLKAGRGVEVLAKLAKANACQAVLVTSTSTAAERDMEATLRAAGVRIITEYLPDIQHMYQLADCYVFPVTTTNNAIEVPLSVLEALACNLRVVTTRFGGLPQMFPDAPTKGLAFVDTPANLVAETLKRMGQKASSTRAMVATHSWDQAASLLIEQILNLSNEPDFGPVTTVAP